MGTARNRNSRDLLLLWARAAGMCSHPDCKRRLVVEGGPGEEATPVGEAWVEAAMTVAGAVPWTVVVQENGSQLDAAAQELALRRGEPSRGAGGVAQPGRARRVGEVGGVGVEKDRTGDGRDAGRAAAVRGVLARSDSAGRAVGVRAGGPDARGAVPVRPRWRKLVVGRRGGERGGCDVVGGGGGRGAVERGCGAGVAVGGSAAGGGIAGGLRDRHSGGGALGAMAAAGRSNCGNCRGCTGRC
jgi:hypothetical protein